MSRSIWKGPFSLKQVLRQNIKEKPTIWLWSRNFMILPEYIGKNVQIYNGKSWSRRKIVEDMVGYKFGEFSYTRKKTVHKVNKIKQISRKKK